MRKIVVATSPRTGSNLLVDSLGRHPDAISGGEWFNPLAEELVLRNRQQPDAIHKCNLFKVFSFEYEHPDCEAIFKDAFVVFLYRKDRFAQIQSWKRACYTGQFVAEERGEPRPFPSYAESSIDQATKLFGATATYVLRYEDMIRRWDFYIQDILALAKWAPRPITQVRRKLPAFT